MQRLTTTFLRRQATNCTKLSLVQQGARQGRRTMATEAVSVSRAGGGTAKYFVIGALTACAATMVALQQSNPSADGNIQQQVNDLQMSISGKCFLCTVCT